MTQRSANQIAGQLAGHFHGGLHLPDHKAESMGSPVGIPPLPERLYVPLKQHIGATTEALVKVGDTVKKGQLIANSDSPVSAPVHAPSSGTIVDINEYPFPHPSGIPAACIVIECDGKDEWLADRITHEDYTSLSAAELQQIIHAAGIVGMGGAGFPSWLKLTINQQKTVETLIINGAECEPYITCDAMLMQERARDVIDGINIIRHAIQAKQVLLGVEDNKPDAIQALESALTDSEQQYIRIVTIPTLYPSGGEKQLIKLLTNKEVPRGQLPIDIGVVCHNAGTTVAVADAVLRGEPLISRYLTVTGGAVKQPQNLQVLFGTPMAFLLEQCGIQQDKLARLVMGGPMMGFSINDQQTPVIKTSNCLLALNATETGNGHAELPCIRCGECARVCPAQLLPQQLYWWAKAKDLDKVQAYNIADCIECGCCAFVCPSHIPLVQYYRFAKTEIQQQQRDKQKSDHARDRHEFRQERLERKKREDEERKRKKKELLKRANADKKDDAKKSAIDAALERVKAKKAQQDGTAKNTEDLTAAQQKQIDEANQRRERMQTVSDKVTDKVNDEGNES